jgi:hypothetical protein
MRVSVIPELLNGTCSCGYVGEVYQFTLSVGHGVETSSPICSVCLDTQKEVAVDIVPPPPPPAGPPSRRMQKASRRNEAKVARGIGGRTQPGSGNQPGAKGDVRKRGEFRVENKDTYSNQYILTFAVLNKIRGECAFREKPALVLTFMEKGTDRPRDRWAIVPYNDWEEHANASGQHR